MIWVGAWASAIPPRARAATAVATNVLIVDTPIVEFFPQRLRPRSSSVLAIMGHWSEQGGRGQVKILDRQGLNRRVLRMLRAGANADRAHHLPKTYGGKRGRPGCSNRGLKVRCRAKVGDQSRACCAYYPSEGLLIQ